MQSLDDIMSGRGEPASAEPTAPAAAEPATPAVPVDTGAARDDKGRFAAKQAEAAAEPAAPVEPQPQQPNGHVPLQALDAERNKRKGLEDQLKEMQQQIQRLSMPPKPVEPPKPAPDFWSSPDEYLQHQLSPVEQRIRDMNERYSERLATKEHGAETVQSAKSWIEQQAATPEGQRIIQELMQSDDPFDDLVKHYKQNSVISEIGLDPEAYKAKLREEIMAEIAAQQSQPAPAAAPPAAAPLPTAFAKGPSAGPRGGPEYGGPRPLADIMKR